MTVLKEAQISRTALQHNFDYFSELAGDKKILACVKANGYGHGFFEIMPILSQADGCYVHTWDAAIRLRRDWPDLRIVLAGFPGSTTLLDHITDEQIDWIVYDAQQIKLLSKMKRKSKSIVVWLKIDTGMCRLGFMPEEVPSVMKLLDQSPLVKDVVLMTHFSCADDVGSAENQLQMKKFQSILQDFQYHYCSVGNTAVVLNPKLGSGDWLRLGIGLYGISPYENQTGSELGLKPVMNFCAKVISVRPCKKGQSVGYGATWQSAQDTTLAVIAIGYGDGYPRNMPNDTPVLINGVIGKLAGRVSMDTIVVDIGQEHVVSVGDWAVLWGPELPVEQIAKHAGTIPYELVTRVGRRVRRCIV